MRLMSDDRRKLIADLAMQRQAARLSQTEVAARMRTLCSGGPGRADA